MSTTTVIDKAIFRLQDLEKKEKSLLECFDNYDIKEIRKALEVLYKHGMNNAWSYPEIVAKVAELEPDSIDLRVYEGGLSFGYKLPTNKAEALAIKRLAYVEKHRIDFINLLSKSNNLIGSIQFQLISLLGKHISYQEAINVLNEYIGTRNKQKFLKTYFKDAYRGELYELSRRAKTLTSKLKIALN